MRVAIRLVLAALASLFLATEGWAQYPSPTYNSVNILGNATIGGALGIAGSATFHNGLIGTLTGHASLDLPLTSGTLSGVLTLPGLIDSGNATVGGTLGVTGATTLGSSLVAGAVGGNTWNLAPGATSGAAGYLTFGGTGLFDIVPPIGGLWIAPTYAYTNASSGNPQFYINGTASGSPPSGSQLFNKIGCNDGVDFLTNGGSLASGSCLAVFDELGTGWSGSRTAIAAILNVNSVPSVAGGAYGTWLQAIGINAASSVNVGGTVGAPAGYLTAYAYQTVLMAGATHYILAEGWEGGVQIDEGASASFVNGGKITVAGCGSLTCNGLAFAGASDGAPMWLAIAIGSAEAAVNPIATTGTVLAFQPALAGAPTVAHGIDLSAGTCTSDCFKSTGFYVGGSGLVNAASILAGDGNVRSGVADISLVGISGTVGLTAHTATSGDGLYVDASSATATTLEPSLSNTNLALRGNGTGGVTIVSPLSLTGLPTTCSGKPTNSVAAVAGALTLCP